MTKIDIVFEIALCVWAQDRKNIKSYILNAFFVPNIALADICIRDSLIS